MAINFSERLHRLFGLNWKRYVGDSELFKPVAATPFWHLGGEPFWHLRRSDGGRIDDVRNTPSAGALTAMGVVASLDTDLVELLKDEVAAERLRGVLVEMYCGAPVAD